MSTERLAALLHSEFCIPLEGERPTWEPDERGTHLPHQPYYLERAARLIAQGVRVGDDGLRAIEHAARDVDGLWHAEDGEVIRWDPEAAEALEDLRAALAVQPAPPADDPKLMNQ